MKHDILLVADMFYFPWIFECGQ